MGKKCRRKACETLQLIDHARRLAGQYYPTLPHLTGHPPEGEAGQAGLATGGRGWKELRGAGQSPRIMRVACRVAAKPLVLPILALL